MGLNGIWQKRDYCNKFIWKSVCLMDFRGGCVGDAGRQENENAFSGGKLGLLGRGAKNRKQRIQTRMSFLYLSACSHSGLIA
jgi:hypothetical protein